MKKLESLKNSKFDSFESNKIVTLAKVFGGASVASGMDRNGCCDSFNWTVRNITNSSGQVIGSVNDQDNVMWYSCSSDSTSVCG